MQCPDCHGQLTDILYEGVSIQSCPKCKGYWLDEKALQEIESKRVISISRDRVHAKPRPYDGTRTCPACSIPMQKAKYGKYVPRTIDSCPQCRKIWLDEGELEDIQVAHEMYEENTGKVK